MKQRQQIIVTGGTGFIGRRLVQQLVKHYSPSQIHCLVWDKHSADENQVVEQLKKLGVHLHFGDLVTNQGLEALPHNPKLVIHLAASTETKESDHRCNFYGTQNLLRVIQPSKYTHIIYTSTTATLAGRKQTAEMINEQMPNQPSNEYGRTKDQAEQLLINTAKKKGYYLTIVRLSTVFGSQTRPDGLFDKLKQLIPQHSLISRLNWPGLTALVHVDDVAKAIILLSKMAPSKKRYQHLILYAENLTFADISQLMHQQLGIPYNPIILPKWLWETVNLAVRNSLWMEKILPNKLYNHLWRVSLITDSILACQTDKARTSLPTWKPRRFGDSVNEVIQ